MYCITSLFFMHEMVKLSLTILLFIKPKIFNQRLYLMFLYENKDDEE